MNRPSAFAYEFVLIGLTAAMAGCGGVSGSSSSAGGGTSAGGSSSAGGAAPFSPQVCARAWGTSSATSSWVYPNSGVLAYKALDSHGDQVMDFSAAGYMGGGVAIPSPAATITVPPIGGGADDTANIQNAIDQVSALPIDNGFRGVVLLSAGNFSVSNTLTISASGVVLRGSGSGTSGTVITDTSPLQNASSPVSAAPGTGTGQTLLSLAGGGSNAIVPSSTVSITDMYVPAGATTLTLSNVSAFKVGDAIMVSRPATSLWIAFMQMDNLGAGEIWMSPGTSTNWQRTIADINGNQITLDIPISDSLDSTYVSPPGGTVSLYTSHQPIVQVGVEHIRFVGVPRTVYTANNMLVVSDMQDSWVNDVVGDNFTSGVTLRSGTLRMTVKSVALTHENNNASVPCTGAKFAEFSIAGSQILVDSSSSTGGKASFYYVTESKTPGPNVLLNFKGTPDSVCSISSIQPHQRWATGLLVDGATLAPNIGVNDSVAGSVDFSNRGAGQGWTVGWSVIWNSIGSFNVQAPPGSMNWVIGSTGTVVPQTTEQPGTFDSPNKPVAPQSLYLAQLCQKLGPTALSNIGY